MEKGYGRYESHQHQISYTFLYPDDWQVREIVKDGYMEAFIGGPCNQAGTYSTSVAVGVTRTANQTPAEAATTLLSKFRSAFSIQEQGPFSTTVAGRPAVEVEIAYWMLLPLNSLHPQRTVIRERSIFFRRGNQLYELNYAAPEEDYETWLGAFRALVESFAFLEEPVSRVSYRPVITAAPQYVREETMEYGDDRGESDEEP